MRLAAQVSLESSRCGQSHIPLGQGLQATGAPEGQGVGVGHLHRSCENTRLRKRWLPTSAGARSHHRACALKSFPRPFCPPSWVRKCIGKQGHEEKGRSLPGHPSQGCSRLGRGVWGGGGVGARLYHLRMTGTTCWGFSAR